MYKSDRKKIIRIIYLLIIIILFSIVILVSLSNKKGINIQKRYQNPTATILYDNKKPTNKNVTVKLINYSTDITIINNDGQNTYVFEENGEFTFEFVDKRGNKGFASAKVDWIDKNPPTAQISYDKNDLTNQDVTATLTDLSEDITILNNDGKNTYTFKENGEFIFIYQDKAGNIGETIAKVDWIDKNIPIAFINFERNIDSVLVKLVSVTEEIIILNNDGKDTYTFKENGEFTFIYQDKAGNIGYTTAKINNLEDKNQELIPKQEIESSINTPTNKEDNFEETIKPTPKPEKEELVSNKDNKKPKKKKINYILIVGIILLIIAIVLIFRIKNKNIN